MLINARKKSQPTTVSIPLKSVVITVIMAVCGTLAIYQPVQAQDNINQQTIRQYNLPAGPLALTLNQIAREAGVALTVNAALVGNASSTAISGNFTVQQALQLALQGTGLMLVTTPVGSYSLERIAEADKSTLSTLPEITIKSGSNSVTEGSTSYTAVGPSNTATKLGLSLRETPQSVSVVTRQTMNDESIQSLDDVAKSVTGITYSKTGSQRSYYYSRGFVVNDLQFDGIPTNVAESYSGDVISTSNMAIFDRVEIVRGANGLLQGSGDPSAAINMIRKRPTHEFQLSAEVGAGSWDNYRTQVDVSGPLSESGHLRGRAVMLYNTAGSFRDAAGKDNRLLYAIGEADVSDATVVSLGATIQKDKNSGYDWGGLNTMNNGAFYPLSRSTSLAGDWAHLDKTNYNLFGDIKHQFDNGWKLTFSASRTWSKADFLASYPARTSATNYNLNVSKTLYDDDQFNLDLYANGPFHLFGREHQLSFGASSRKNLLAYTSYGATNNPNVNILDIDRDAIVAPNINYAAGTPNRLTRSEKGLFGAARFNVTDSLKLVLGSRISWAAYDVLNPTTSTNYKENGKLIPYAGVVYDLTNNHALYASVTEIYKTQSSFNTDNQLLKPITGRNYELGMKSELFDGNANATVALFQIDQTNLPETVGIKTCGATGAADCYREAGKVRSRGIEIELAGALTPDWNAIIGYTYSNPKYVEGAKQGTTYNSSLPRRLLKLSTDYRLPGSFSDLRIGGSVHIQSKMYNQGIYQSVPFNIVQGGYALVNLHANYQINRHLDLQFNINNLFDKYYYQSISATSNWGGLFFGDPRNVMLTLRYKY